MVYNPVSAYDIERTQIPVREFHDYADEYIIRPAYQRKTVWSRKQHLDLLDSLFRRYYIPNIVLRLVRLSDSQTVREVIDGQQRIHTIQLFYNDELAIPNSLRDFAPELVGKMHKDLPSDVRRYIEKELRYNADIVKGIGDPKDPEHVQIASYIFWRLQQGEKLNALETAHARLTSRVRNFLVKYADDYDFDFEKYRSIDPNDLFKHPFFGSSTDSARRVYGRRNRRMEHLGMLARLLLVELADGPARTQDAAITLLIDETRDKTGIGDQSYEKEGRAQSLLDNLGDLYDIFKNDRVINNSKGIEAFKYDYFVVSSYILTRHLNRYYVFEKEESDLFRDFIHDFYQRTRSARVDGVDDLNATRFAEFRQQGQRETEERDRIIRHEFFTFARKRGHKLLAKDTRRAFSEAERIAIYRRDRGRCQMCIAEGKPDRECIVPWREFEADHVLPHSQGGQTIVENGRVLCRTHNRSRSARR